MMFCYIARIGYCRSNLEKAKKGKKEQSQEGARYKEGKDCCRRKEVNVLKAHINALYYLKNTWVSIATYCIDI